MIKQVYTESLNSRYLPIHASLKLFMNQELNQFEIHCGVFFGPFKSRLIAIVLSFKETLKLT